jgi:CubicO group peptidase (beta-lactamase class C family)
VVADERFRIWKKLAALAVTASALVMTAAAAEVPAAREFHELGRADADAWLDGFIPNALTLGDVAGAVVVIVKDGQVLTQRGYGYADVDKKTRVDPDTTLFRPGSISKLFTWTSVMQLVEQGKIDLDSDINRYLDFKIPAYRGLPITMRNLMTHTPGFEQSVKGLIHLSGKMSPMGLVLQRWIPRRIFAPGTTPAYSNYGAALACYIVQRVSGLPFEDYVEKNIFRPLGMSHSTLRQPLPADLAPLMAKGYQRASESPKPFELVEPSGAGGSTVSGSDMAKFMIAHLNQGAGLMQPSTARLMQTPAYSAVPGANRMALGFLETKVNGLSTIGHPGDMFYFHSELWLLPTKNVGLYIAMNSIGTSRAEAVDAIRKSLLETFADRYFPRSDVSVELPTARAHARLLVGSYLSSTGSFSNFVDAAHFLDQRRISLDENGRPTIDATGGPAREWLEVEPFVWKDALGHGYLGAKLEDGKIASWGLDDPANLWVRVSWYRNATWLRPLFLAALMVIALQAISWPIIAIARRRYRADRSLHRGELWADRLLGIFCWLIIAAIIGWASLLANFIPLVDNDGSLDARILLQEVGGTISLIGLSTLALWKLRRVWRGRDRLAAKLWSVLVVLSTLSIGWVMVAFHLTHIGVHY